MEPSLTWVKTQLVPRWGGGAPALGVTVYFFTEFCRHSKFSAGEGRFVPESLKAIGLALSFSVSGRAAPPDPPLLPASAGANAQPLTGPRHGHHPFASVPPSPSPQPEAEPCCGSDEWTRT